MLKLLPWLNELGLTVTLETVGVVVPLPLVVTVKVPDVDPADVPAEFHTATLILYVAALKLEGMAQVRDVDVDGSITSIQPSLPVPPQLEVLKPLVFTATPAESSK